MAAKKQSKANSRFTDLYDEPVGRLLSPIKGYQDQPLVSLAETIKPVSQFFNEIEDHIFVALHNCRQPADGLDQQESASIHLYTMEFDVGPSLYQILNRSLRAENRQELKPWFSFLKLFLTALYKLPSERRTIWRGIKNVDLSSKYQLGDTFAWWGVSSCTTSINILESDGFLGKTGERTLFSIECIHGKSIGNHSYFQNTENEMILMPGSYFEVVGQLNPAPQLHIIHLKEIQPPIQFIKPPFIKSNNTNTSPIVDQSKSSNFHPKPKGTKIPNLNINQTWKQHGTTIAGGYGKGHQSNQFNRPFGFYIDDDRTMYIADYENHRIVEWECDANSGRTIAGGNGRGNRNDQLNYPTKVIIDKETDSLIIADHGNRRVMRWPRQTGRTGEILISDIDCWDLTMANDGYLYISDDVKHEVRRWKMGETHEATVAGGKGQGNSRNQLNDPGYIFVDEDRSIYVSDCGNQRVVKWLKGAKEGIVVAGGHGQGDSLKQLSFPNGIIVDQLGSVYIAEKGNNRVVRWLKGAKEGTIVVGGTGGEQANQFYSPRDLSFDEENNLYVLDGDNNRVQKFHVNLNKN